MSSAGPTTSDSPLRFASHLSEAERELLQARLRVFGATAGGLSLVFYGLVNALLQVGEQGAGGGWLELRNLGILWVAAVFGALWAFTSARTWSERTLRAAEVLATWGACLGCAIHGWGEGGAGPFRFNALLATNNILVVRAILVPSGVRRTLWISAVAVLPVVIPAQLHWLGGGEAAPGGWLDTALFIGWPLVAVSVAVVISTVIYGLYRSLLKARRLGQYQIEERIGGGGMGEVYLARHALLRRPTAIKLLRPDRAGEDAIAQFEQEVQVTARLTHPNTVAIYDYGRTPDGVFYYAMEHLPGLDLETLVDRHGAQPPARVVHLLRQIAGSLAEAHGIGLVHRDVKAANVILCVRGGRPDVAKVVDFGLVKPISRDDADPSASNPGGDPGLVVGTPTYLAPEAFTGSDEAHPQRDLYAVGVLGYLLLCGQLPFRGHHPAELAGQHMFREPAPPSEAGAVGVPADLEAVVLRCLRKDPAERPAGARELAELLDRCELAGRWSVDDARRWWREHGAQEPATPSASESGRTSVRWTLPMEPRGDGERPAS